MHWHESCATFFVHPWIVVEIKRVHIDADNERNFGQDFFFSVTKHADESTHEGGWTMHVPIMRFRLGSVKLFENITRSELRSILESFHLPA